jgi:hypothetical protein
MFKNILILTGRKQNEAKTISEKSKLRLAKKGGIATCPTTERRAPL